MHTENAQKDRLKAKVFSISVISVMTLMLVVSMLKAPSKFSELENRNLAQFKAPTVKSVMDGQFMEDFSSYITDQFVFRNFFVSVKANSEKLMGKKENNGVIFGKDNYLIASLPEYNEDEIDKNITAMRALANMGHFNLSVAIVPSAFEIKQDKLPKFAYKNTFSKMMERVVTELDGSDIAVINTYDTLKKHEEEYIYYRNDHHQTALGSYYTYCEIAKAYDLEANEFSNYEMKPLAKDFLGTNYSKAPILSKKPDEVRQFSLKQGPTFTVEGPNDDYKLDGLFDYDKLKQKDKYMAYIGGNHPLTVIKSDAGTGRNLAIFKDSYSHSIIPFLAAHYDTIHLLDLRYFTTGMYQYLLANNIDEVLFLYSDASFLSGSNISKIKSDIEIYEATAPTFGRVEEGERVDEGFFADALFIGDSITMGFRNCTDLPVEFMCWGGGGTKEVLTKPNEENGIIIIDEACAKEDINKYYILLGLNEIILTTDEEFIEQYAEIIDRLREAKPDCDIYIQSMMPISHKCEADTSLTMEEINRTNGLLEALAEEKNCFYLNVCDAVADDDGYLPEEAAPGDGIHFGAEYHAKWQEYLMTHTYGASESDSEEVEEFELFEEDREDLEEIADKLLDEVDFAEKLNPVHDRIIANLYGVQSGDALSGMVLTSSGATAEEIAIFKVKDAKQAKKIKEKVYKRIEDKKGDFENYIPKEMGKLNDPCVASNGDYVVMCLSDHNGDVEEVLEEFELRID